MKLNRIPAREGREERHVEPERPGPRRTEDRPHRPEPPAGRHVPRWALWTTALVAFLLLALVVYYHSDEFLRRTLEAKMNERLTGYTVSLDHAHLSILNLSLTLKGATIRQQAHPDPPVAHLPRLTASVEWRELLRFHLVADAEFDRPRIHLNLPQLQKENRDEVDVEDRGWQDALQSIYPLKFNTIRIREGDIVYIDQDPERPLHISRWNLTAENIRNVRSAEGVYPSPIRTDGILFGKGRGVLEGHADFLSKPYPGIHAKYRVDDVPLDRLGQVSNRANVDIDGGILDSQGEFEFSPKHREVHISDVTIGALRVDYIHSAATAEAEEERGEKVAEAVKDDTPQTLVRIDRISLDDSVVGLVDRAHENPYRVYLDQVDLDVTNFSSGFREGPVKAKLTSKLMGTGTVRASGTFREPSKGTDFDIDIAVENASLPAMNEVLRSYGKLDVVKGTFSVYSEIKIANGRIDGYVKPLYTDVDVYDREQDKKKPILKKLYEKVVGGLSHILENQPRDEVATVVDISGPLENPNSSVWEIVGGLLRNAFIKAILPGFDREVERIRKD
jgi:hypothetical protein